MFWHNNFLGAKNTFERTQGKTESDDETDYENADVIVQQKHDSDNSDYEHIDFDDAEQRSAVDHVYESVEIYGNCVE